MSLSLATSLCVLCSGDLVPIVVFFQVTLPLFKEWEDDNDFLACLCLKVFGLVGSGAGKSLRTGLTVGDEWFVLLEILFRALVFKRECSVP